MTLIVENINKTYPNKIKAIKDLSLELHAGEVLGLVGPNGAGKSTLLKVLCGLLRAESGRIMYGGEDITGDPVRAAKYIGLMPDPLGVYTDITSYEYLEFFARVLEIPAREQAARIAGIVEELGLEQWLDEEVETLSAGWQRRLALGRILLADMPVLLLDEPAAGLDISARKELLEVVKKLAAGNRAIIISSHILPELEDLADRFGIIAAGEWQELSPGRIFFTRDELSCGIGGQSMMLRCSDIEQVKSMLVADNLRVRIDDDKLYVDISGGDKQVADIIASLCEKNIAVYEVDRIHAGLSEVVLDVLKSNSGEENND